MYELPIWAQIFLMPDRCKQQSKTRFNTCKTEVVHRCKKVGSEMPIFRQTSPTRVPVSEIPSLRQNSGTDVPSSACFRAKTICSSVNRDFSSAPSPFRQCRSCRHSVSEWCRISGQGHFRSRYTLRIANSFSVHASAVNHNADGSAR